MPGRKVSSHLPIEKTFYMSYLHVHRQSRV